MIILGIVICAILFAIGVPLYVAFGTGGLIIIFLYAGFSIRQLAAMYFDTINTFVLLALPLFIFAGSLMVHGGISKPLVQLFNSFSSRMPGGLAVASIAAAAFIGAMTGSAFATLAMVGLVMFPAMIEAKYDRGYSAGVLCSSCTLGNFIPPSIVLIIFGFLTEQSVSRLFMAAIMPGLLLAALLAVTAMLIARRKKFPLAPTVGWQERGRLFVKALPAIFMPVIILGGIYGGIFTPTEAAAVACVYCLLIGAFVYRGLNWKSIWASLTETADLTGRILIIIVAGMMIARAFMLAGFPAAITNWVVATGLTRMTLLIFTILAFLVLGMIMEAGAVMFIVIPLIWPSVMALGVDPIHLGIIFCISMGIASITPPMALAMFVTSSLFDTPIEELTRGVLPFLGAMILAMVIITIFPEISLWLPSTMLGGG